VYGYSHWSGNDERYGVYGTAGSGADANYGVYGYGGVSPGNANYGVYGESYDGTGVYYSNGLAGTGTKSAVVKTEEGPRLVYCQESPENWFEDFGSSIINNGEAIVYIASDFLQTVTINSDHQFKVFITPNAKIGEWWVEKKDNYFILYAPDAMDGAAFDYRLVAKRKGFENQRLVHYECAYTDTYLYPSVNDVPEKFKKAWLSKNKERDD